MNLIVATGFSGVSTPVPFTAAQPPEFPELDDSAPSRCGRCGSTLAAENNFCGRCGLARSNDRGYQHPEKLLPGGEVWDKWGVEYG